MNIAKVADESADVDATVVTRILEAGGHVTGKAACEVSRLPLRFDQQNFSHGATSASSPYGPVENPYADGFTCGGSSSGCGGLIGSGVADMGIGGDQGGSIRIVRNRQGTANFSAGKLLRDRRSEAYLWLSPLHRCLVFRGTLGSSWTVGNYRARHGSAATSYCWI